jgi:hypothetical protein
MNPELTLDMATQSVEEGVAVVMNYLIARRLIRG